MTWTAPVVERVDELFTGEEREVLLSYLNWHRQTLLFKCGGLTAEQLKQRSVEPSGLSLLGLVRHMTKVERWWFRRRAANLDLPNLYDIEDGDFDDVDGADAERDYATFVAECELAEAAVANLPLEHVYHHEKLNKDMSLRWIYLHMLEEYARHNGHADLLRERIDGVTGD